jgi:hypothetical protein
MPPKLCGVSKSNCTRCHMPEVTTANRHLTFTDHFIRIVKRGASYPNRAVPIPENHCLKLT